MKLIDMEHLKRQTMDDDALMFEILQLFIPQIETLASQLRLPDANVAELAHGIKGSAKAVGAFDLAAIAEKIEQTGDGLDENLCKLERAIEATLAEVHSLVASR